MWWLLLSLVIIGLGGFISLLNRSSLSRSALWGGGSTVLGCALGFIPVVSVLSGTQLPTVSTPWQVPFGTLSLGLDSISALFLLPILVLSIAAAIYGTEYIDRHIADRSPGVMWAFFNLLVGSMIVVVTARNGILFLVAWELMAISSFCLVAFDDRDPQVQSASWTYLVASHMGTGFLLVMFALMGALSGSLDFAAMQQFGGAFPELANVVFLLALVGFGTKAGFVPLYVWLPEAHPAAPSHVSALMSGVMIKTGIYGLLRILIFLGMPPAWWGYLLVGIGILSGLFGILFAIAEHDIKRLLAYSSVENIGVIAIGLGLGLLGMSYGIPMLTLLGFAGAFLHVINHALFKGLLFLAAGSVVHATGTRIIDALGGLAKRMPRTASYFLLGSVAICSLPPLNGFVGEFLIYFGAYEGLIAHNSSLAALALGAISGLALIGGLAAACFTKAFGIIFSGEPRSEIATTGHEAGVAMQLAMLLLAASCVVVGLTAPLALTVVLPAVLTAGSLSAEVLAADIFRVSHILFTISAIGAGFLGVIFALTLLRWRLLRNRVIGATVTWDCGYARPTARMQYSASSFSQPITTLFRSVIWHEDTMHAPLGLFPNRAHFRTKPRDTFKEGVYEPVFKGVSWSLARMRWLQHGALHFYILYIALAALALVLLEL